MKIVHICRKFLEGFAYQDNELVEIQTAMGHEVTVITSASDNSSLYFDMSLINTTEAYTKGKNKQSFNIIHLPLKHKVNFRFWNFAKLYETLQRIQPELIFFHGAPMFCLLDIAKYKKHNPTVKLFMDFHSDRYNSGRGFLSVFFLHKMIYRSIIRKTAKQVDLYYYLAPNIKNFIQKMYHIKENKLEYLPRGANLNFIDYENATEIRKEIRDKLKIPVDALVIISGGKLDRIKMVHNLAKAFNRLDNKSVHLILFGSIEKEYEQQLYRAINGNPNIHTIGWVGAKEVNDYFLASDIACFPGRHSVLWEQSICCGLPLIVKDWYKGMHYLNVKNNVLLMEDGEVAHIEQALKKLIYNKELRLAMHENALQEGKYQFSYHRIAQKIIDDATNQNA